MLVTDSGVGRNHILYCMAHHLTSDRVSFIVSERWVPRGLPHLLPHGTHAREARKPRRKLVPSVCNIHMITPFVCNIHMIMLSVCNSQMITLLVSQYSLCCRT